MEGTWLLVDWNTSSLFYNCCGYRIAEQLFRRLAEFLGKPIERPDDAYRISVFRIVVLILLLLR